MKKTGETIIGEGQWLSLKRSSFVDEQGQEFQWEHLGRKKTGHAVVILATIVPQNELLLIRQFRAGANATILGLPAGMMEPGMGDAGTQALRELKEETGYTGTLQEVGPVVYSFPALSDATMQLVRVRIDGNAPENIQPKQELEPGEIISTLRVPRLQIRAFLEKEIAAGTPVVSSLWYLFALGDFEAIDK